MKRWVAYANGDVYDEEKAKKVSPKVRRWRRNGTTVASDTWFLAKKEGGIKLGLAPEHVDVEEKD